MAFALQALEARLHAALVFVCLLAACASKASGGGTSGAGDTGEAAGTGTSATGPTGDGSGSTASSSAGDLTTGPDIETGTDCSFDDSVVFDHLRGTVLQLESAGGNTCVRLHRREEVAGDSLVTWALVESWVGELGSVAHVEDGDAMCWHNTHHNWKDRGSVWTGRTHWDLTFDQEEQHGAPVTYTLQAFARGPIDPAHTNCVYQDGDDPLFEPIELFPVNP